MSRVDEQSRPTSAVVKDPVCGMDVYPVGSEHHVEHDGATYHFCSANCQAKFQADPVRYASAQSTSAAPAPESTSESGSGSEGQEYTCPMHPEVRQSGRGHALSAAWRSNLSP